MSDRYNARVGPSSDCTGSHGPDFFDEAGTRASLFCLEHGLCLANTYDGVMGGHRPETWRDRRLDYVAVPASCLGSCKIVDLDFDLLNFDEDHVALCLDFSVRRSLPAASQRTCSRPSSLARAAVGRDPSTALATLQGSASRSLGWETNAHTRSAQKSLNGPRKPFTSQEVMAFIRARERCDRILRQLDEQVRLSCLEGFFRGWRDGVGGGPMPCVRDNRRARLARAAVYKPGVCGVAARASTDVSSGLPPNVFSSPLARLRSSGALMTRLQGDSSWLALRCHGGGSRTDCLHRGAP